MKKLIISLCIAMVTLSFAADGFAMPILEGSRSGSAWLTGPVTDSEGKTRNAAADFIFSNNQLIIDLVNIADYTHVPNQVLVGLFLDIDGIVINNPHVTAKGPLILSSAYTTDHGDNLDGEWGFRNDLNDVNGGLGDYGICASSYDPLSFSEVIDEDKRYIPQPPPAGADFGIAGGDVSSLVSSVNSYVMDRVRISFDVTGTFTNDNIKQVNFLYGTDYKDDVPIPEPGTLMLLGSGLLGAAAYGRKRFRK